MATKILMPQLGESVTEGTISKWLVSVGDRVEKYAPICEVITDKVNAEVPSSVTGTITEIIANEDETVSVGGVICIIQEAGTTESSMVLTDQGKQETASEPVPSSVVPPTAANLTVKSDSNNQRYSPAVLMLASEHNIDLARIAGTGLNGRVTRKDVLLFIEKGQGAVEQTSPILAPSVPIVSKRAEVTQPSYKSTSPTATPIQTATGDIEIPITPIRKAIAQRMTTSKHEAPHAWMMVEVDVTNLVNYRQQVKDEFKKNEGLNLTYLPFFIKAVVDAIKEYPMLNSQWAGDKIIQKKEINVSIAVATEDALFVPVIKRADEKSIIGLTRSIDDLARRARQGKLTQEDISGGTFTVNNTGSFGSILSTPIINYPQAAILSVEAIVKRPVIYNNMIAIRDIANLCLSLDHRILDGLVCGRFMQSVKQKIESISMDTIL